MVKITDDKIRSIKNNLFHRSQNSISDYYNFDWHNYQGEIDTDKVNSSQALTIDFWGCLNTSLRKTELINFFFGKSENDWEIKFEYVDKTLLSETRPTQIDVLIESETCVLVFESKFTEKDGGGCSQVNKTKRNLYQCNGNYEDQINPTNNIKSKCALTGKGIKYWDYIDTLTDYKKGENFAPCPFVNGEYQWMRNICFTEAFGKKYDKNAECFLVYLESTKCAISNKVFNGKYLGKLKGRLNNNSSLSAKSYNDLIKMAISYLHFDSSEKQVWMDLMKWMEKKESLL